MSPANCEIPFPAEPLAMPMLRRLDTASQLAPFIPARPARAAATVLRSEQHPVCVEDALAGLPDPPGEPTALPVVAVRVRQDEAYNRFVRRALAERNLGRVA